MKPALAVAAREMSTARGRARQARRLFHRFMIPMLIVDNDRRLLEANPAARLLLRLSLEELRTQRLDDLTPDEQLPMLETRWRESSASVCSTGTRELRLLDGSRLLVSYCRLPNLLPGRHLTAFAPAGWPDDELAALEGQSAPAPAGPLSRREREVLSLVATGADLQHIADELTISPSTVRTHIGNAHRKLGARNRTHTVALAMQQGAIDVPAVRESSTITIGP
jgi:DNA-binding CsgD family transcriptional regulator